MGQPRFYYNTAGVGFSDQTINIGSYRASEDDLSKFEGQQTTVEIAN